MECPCIDEGECCGSGQLSEYKKSQACVEKPRVVNWLSSEQDNSKISRGLKEEGLWCLYGSESM